MLEPPTRFHRPEDSERFMVDCQEGERGRLKNARKYLTGAANFHLVFPVFVNLTFANRTIDKPAKVSALKFPGRTLFLLFGRTVFYSPAWFSVFPAAIYP